VRGSESILAKIPSGIKTFASKFSNALLPALLRMSLNLCNVCLSFGKIKRDENI
jgi:hypothetical protein